MREADQSTASSDDSFACTTTCKFMARCLNTAQNSPLSTDPCNFISEYKWPKTNLILLGVSSSLYSNTEYSPNDFTKILRFDRLEVCLLKY
jgi:hypothetical protein